VITYLNENRIFSNLVNLATFWGGKGKRATLIKRVLINARV